MRRFEEGVDEGVELVGVSVGWGFEANCYPGRRFWIFPLHASHRVEILDQRALGVSWRGFVGDVRAGKVDFYAERVGEWDLELGGGDEAVAFCYVGWGAGYGDYEGFGCLSLLRGGCCGGDFGDDG